jgi:hypothetical protein
MAVVCNITSYTEPYNLSDILMANNILGMFIVFLPEWLVTNRMYNMMWRDSSVRPVRGVHWDINFYPVEKTPKNVCRKYTLNIAQ